MRLSLSPFVRVTSTPIRYDGCLLAGGACFGVGTKERLTGNGAGEFFNGFLFRTIVVLVCFILVIVIFAFVSCVV